MNAPIFHTGIEAHLSVAKQPLPEYNFNLDQQNHKLTSCVIPVTNSPFAIVITFNKEFIPETIPHAESDNRLRMIVYSDDDKFRGSTSILARTLLACLNHDGKFTKYIPTIRRDHSHRQEFYRFKFKYLQDAANDNVPEYYAKFGKISVKFDWRHKYRVEHRDTPQHPALPDTFDPSAPGCDLSCEGAGAPKTRDDLPANAKQIVGVEHIVGFGPGFMTHVTSNCQTDKVPETKGDFDWSRNNALLAERIWLFRSRAWLVEKGEDVQDKGLRHLNTSEMTRDDLINLVQHYRDNYDTDCYTTSVAKKAIHDTLKSYGIKGSAVDETGAANLPEEEGSATTAPHGDCVMTPETDQIDNEGEINDEPSDQNMSDSEE